MTIRTDVTHLEPYGPEHDACAIYMSVRKGGRTTFGTLKRALAALNYMGHRTGFVNGEGDGVGVQTDIPRQLWANKLSQAGLRSSLATENGFWVGHLLVPHTVDYHTLREQVNTIFNAHDLTPLIEMPGRVRHEALGRIARQEPSAFWQLAGYSNAPELEQQLFAVQTQIEAELPLHFASLSSHSVVYKVRGSTETLARYYPDLQDRNFDTAMALCHARYSTNTVSSFERAQPFSLLGHNGEINTISRFRQEARQIGASLPQGGSDSQDVDRALHTLVVEYGLDLIEAIEMIFPPVPHEVGLMPPTLRDVYARMRYAYGPFAQGPAAIIARYGDMAAFSVDALGLRPLWFVETEKEFIFSSERGAVPLENMVSDPRALAPGEKMALRINRGRDVEVFDHAQMKHHVTRRAYQREMPGITSRYGTNTYPERSGIPMTMPQGTPGTRPTPVQEPQPVPVLTSAAPAPAAPLTLPWRSPEGTPVFNTAVLSAMGWQREHLRELDSLASSGKDLVGSLGHDGPLAVLSHHRVNVADFFKETVAVVTNPSIDRGREGEAFSTKVIIGPRPEVDAPPHPTEHFVELGLPLLSGGHPILGGEAVATEVADALGTLSLSGLIDAFQGRVACLTLGLHPYETTEEALNRLALEAVEAVRAGVQCIILDDSLTIEQGLGWLDPHLATAFIDDALRDSPDAPNLRRRVGLVVRSASVRTLHDIALLCGFGADAINPYAMLGVAINAYKGRTPDDEAERVGLQVRLFKALKVGLEKVISTMGCHELRAYGRVFSSIGLAPDVAAIFATPNYFGSADVGLTWGWLDDQAAARAEELAGDGGRSRLAKVDRFYPKFWKKVENYGTGEGTYEDILDTFESLTTDMPVALRHVLGFRKAAESSIEPDTVDISIDGYDLPLVISAMSFGSQGELSYKAYAQAAEALNIICVNGEGGELPELMGVYKRHRGQQVASGRFGVNAGFLNSSAVIEIKIGQGAKPGEGGMLPGYKVTPQVASARHTNPYIPLLSPSNNHDLYSIEDLAQLIEELKTVNPEAKVSVKCPVVPGIGVIAVGVAKAGADIITLTGYDGATGAARKHALQYVGLPAEIGVIQAHRALSEAGLRRQVEIWCDGGMKIGSDVVKMVLLGANRVGMATMAMVAMGCTICRKCNEGTCHVGITTHIKTVDEAEEKGLPSFVPRVYDESVHGIMRVFRGIGAEIQQIVASLGAESLQELVGRADLLMQAHSHDKIDLRTMFEPVPLSAQLDYVPGVGRLLTRPRNNLTRIINELVVETLQQGVPEATYQDEVMAYDRAIAANIAGELQRRPDLAASMTAIHLRFGPSSIAGNGLAAWVTDGIDILIEGGGQDGVAKGASGGRVAVMKGLNHDGARIDGSVGKSFAYGAQRGVLIVQGNADSRACIRLSGADVIFGGEITNPIDDSLGSIGTHANLKGFACEYMTSGRVMILGDPGPYAFAGMTGGVVYQLLTPGMGFTVNVLRSRFAEGAEVCVEPITEDDVGDIQELLGFYIDALERTDQRDVAERIWSLSDPHIMQSRFVKIVPDYHETRL